MKRSHAPSIVDAAKRQREEAASAAAAVALAEQPEAPAGRTLRHREGRGASADAKPAGPTRDYIDITGKQPKKRGRPKKNQEDEEEEPVLPDDDEEEAPSKGAEAPEDTPASELSVAGEKENIGAEDVDPDLPLDARPPKRKASEVEATFFQVIYHQVNTKRERETHDGARRRPLPSLILLGILRVCGKKATLLNFKSGREVTSTDECGIEVLEGMAVRMNKRDMDVRAPGGPCRDSRALRSARSSAKQSLRAASSFSRRHRRSKHSPRKVILSAAPHPSRMPAAAKAALPSWIQKFAMPGTMVKTATRKSLLSGKAGFVVPLKGREKPEDLSIPKFDPDTPGAVVLHRPLSKTDKKCVVRNCLSHSH